MSLIGRRGRVTAGLAKAPVRVKLERMNCDVAKSLPPDGDEQVWLDRLQAALGTASIEFVTAWRTIGGTHYPDRALLFRDRATLRTMRYLG